MKKPFRIWMTGCVAVVMAALGAGRASATFDVESVKRLSRFGLTETVQRLEASAPSRGFSVFASVQHAATHDAGVSAVIVFESSRGGTPVWMESDMAAPHLPLTLRVVLDASGSTQVLIAGALPDDLPADVMQDLAQLQGLVTDALA